MSIMQGILLGLLQGLTEFIPVSSSGHLALGRMLFGIVEKGLALDVALHFGTLFSILWYYRRRITNPATVKSFIMPVTVGIIPAILVGMTASSFIEGIGGYPYWIGFFFLCTGGILFSTRYAVIGNQTLNWKNALLIGLIQVSALLPGVSRSGVTIATSLHAGLSRKDAVDFSFFMAIPLLLGSALYEFRDILTISRADLPALLLGILTSFFSGLLAIHILVSFLKHDRFHFFAYYCWIMAATTFFVF